MGAVSLFYFKSFHVEKCIKKNIKSNHLFKSRNLVECKTVVKIHYHVENWAKKSK